MATNLELEELMRQQKEKEAQDASNARMAAIGDAYANTPSFGEFLTGKFKGKNSVLTDLAKQQAAQGSPIDDFEKKEKLREYLRTKQQREEESDPTSMRSQIARDSLNEAFPNLAKKFGQSSSEQLSSAISNPLLLAKAKAQIDAQNDIARIQREKDLSNRNMLSELKAKAEYESLKPKTPDASQSVSAGFAKRAVDSEKNINSLLATGYNPNTVWEGLRSTFDRTRSGERAQYDQAERDFITAVLRKESGANIPDDELANEKKKYFPQPGDDEKTLEQKAQSRANAIAALKVGAGPAYAMVEKQVAGDSLGVAKNQNQAPKENPYAHVPQGEIKVVNGKTYEKVSGGWQEVNLDQQKLDIQTVGFKK